MKLALALLCLIFSLFAGSQEIDSNWLVNSTLSKYYIDTATLLPAATFVDEQGKRKTLENYKGKILYVDVWATWCGNCLIKFPHQEQLMKRLKAVDLDTSIVFVNINIDDTKRQWKKALKKYKPHGVNLYSGDTSLYEHWNMPAIPTYLLLDTAGRVLGKGIAQPDDGAIDWILYAATKGIHPVEALWINLRQYELYAKDRSKKAFTNKMYADWHDATLMPRVEYFKWRQARDAKKKPLPIVNNQL